MDSMIPARRGLSSPLFSSVFAGRRLRVTISTTARAAVGESDLPPLGFL